MQFSQQFLSSKLGSRASANIRCYHGNNYDLNNGHFRTSPVDIYLPANLSWDQNFSFPTLFDSYRELLLSTELRLHDLRWKIQGALDNISNTRNHAYKACIEPSISFD